MNVLHDYKSNIRGQHMQNAVKTRPSAADKNEPVEPPILGWVHLQQLSHNGLDGLVCKVVHQVLERKSRRSCSSDMQACTDLIGEAVSTQVETNLSTDWMQ